MDTSKFIRHFDNSLKLLLDITRRHCYNDISETFKFLIQPSGTDFHDGLNELDRKNLTVLKRHIDKLLSFDQTIALLYHDNKVPLWINMEVYEAKTDMTIIRLLCSRRLRHDSELYYNSVAYPPFNIHVPIPPDTLRKDINGKFDINWKKHLDDKQKNIWTKIKRLFNSDT